MTHNSIVVKLSVCDWRDVTLAIGHVLETLRAFDGGSESVRKLDRTLTIIEDAMIDAAVEQRKT